MKGVTILSLFLIILLSCEGKVGYRILKQEAEISVLPSDHYALKINDRITLAIDGVMANDTILFYLSPRVQDLIIRHGNTSVPFRMHEDKLMIAVSAAMNVLDLSYVLPCYNSRTFYADSMQFYLLNESGYLPLSSFFIDKDSILFDISTNMTQIVYPTSRNRFTSVSTRRPDILGGKFVKSEIFKNEKTYTFYTPRNLNADMTRLENVVHDVVASDSLFTTFHGPVSDTMHVFFTSRSGGHSLSASSLMLDQSFAETGKKDAFGLIAHEIAHGWWGQTITSESSALMESLVEYHASLYLSYSGKTNELRTFYAAKSADVEIEGYEPKNFESMDPSAGYRYRSAAYKMIPKLYYQLEQSVGRDYMVSRLARLYNAGIKQRRIGFSDLVQALDNGSKASKEFRQYMEGNSRYPNFQISNVHGNEIHFTFTGLDYPRSIPVKIELTDGSTIIDTVTAGPEGKLIRKFSKEVRNAVIDPDFTLVQSKISDDVWIKQEDRIFAKVPRLYDEMYYDFARDYLYYVFSKDSSIQPDHLAASPKAQQLLREACASVRKADLTLIGYELFIDENQTGTPDFKIYISFKYNGNTVKGFTNGSLIVESAKVKIAEINRLSL